jgi:hypothetical protein
MSSKHYADRHLGEGVPVLNWQFTGSRCQGSWHAQCTHINPKHTMHPHHVSPLPCPFKF